jgi:hypothetical protein
MKQLFLSLFAIGLAGFAAMAATSLFLSTPVRVAPGVQTQASPGNTLPALAIDTAKPAAPATTPGTTPDGAATSPGQAPAGNAPAGAPGAAPPAGDTAPDDGPDKDPYEGIAPEELPPDLQYNADSSVSFPTNI